MSFQHLTGFHEQSLKLRSQFHFYLLLESEPSLNPTTLWDNFFCRNPLGVVVQSGAIEIGEIAKIEPNHYPALSDVPYDRFLDFLSKIPKGKVVTYKQVIQGIGVDKSYFRVIPTYLKKTPIDYPIHRVLDSQGRTVSHIPQQKELLEGEGIKVVSQADSADNHQFSVSLEKYAWEDLSWNIDKSSTSENY